MNRDWLVAAKILTGICTLAVSSFSQTYTVSAKPGAVNFVEGEVSVNGDPVWRTNLRTTFLNANDTISVQNGKAEVLLTPGVFLRLGDNSQVRMINPSLVGTQVEVISGESMIEVDDLVPGSSIAVMDHGSSTTLTKPGLYRFSERSIATLDGKAEVALGEKKINLKKNKEVQLGDALLEGKVDLSQPDELYAWSNERAQYNAAASYAGSTQAYQGGGYGFSSFASPGWYWNSPFSAYMWMPGNGAFFSPFGWGFYGPSVVSFAPVIGVPYGYGYGRFGYLGGAFPVVPGKGTTTVATTGTAKPAPIVVPVNPKNVPVTNFKGTSPAAFEAARLQMQQNFGYNGMRTANGTPAAVLRPNQTFSTPQAAAHAAAASAHSSAAAASSGNGGGGWSGGGGGRASFPAGGAGAHGSGGVGVSGRSK